MFRNSCNVRYFVKKVFTFLLPSNRILLLSIGSPVADIVLHSTDIDNCDVECSTSIKKGNICQAKVDALKEKNYPTSVLFSYHCQTKNSSARKHRLTDDRMEGLKGIIVNLSLVFFGGMLEWG